MDLIKRFNEYFDKIEESLNTPSEITWIDNDLVLDGLFKIDDIDYKIECKKQIGNNWSFTFYFLNDSDNWSSEISHKGISSLRVFSTIKEGIIYLYENKKPDSIIFSAIDDSDTRKRLYTSFCVDFCEKENLKFLDRGTDKRKLFIIFNDNLSTERKEDIFSSATKVIEEGK